VEKNRKKETFFLKTFIIYSKIGKIAEIRLELKKEKVRFKKTIIKTSF